MSPHLSYRNCFTDSHSQVPFNEAMCTLSGTVWSWGDGDYGKLGHGGSDGGRTPRIIDKLQSLGVVRVFCGSHFSVALTRDGQLFTW